MAGQIIKRKHDTYVVRLFLGRDSKGKREYINETVKGTRKDAERLLARLQHQHDRGELHKPVKTIVNEYLDRWLGEVVKPRVRPQTHKSYVSLLRLYIRPTLGNWQLSDITAAHIQRVYADMLGQGLSSRTVHYTNTVFGDALSHAVRWGLIGQNPTEYVDLPRRTKQEMHAMTAEEVRQFLGFARYHHLYELFALLLATGLRPSEALALRWEDVDLEKGAVRVRRSLSRVAATWNFDEPKTPRSRRQVEMPASLVGLMHLFKAKNSAQSQAEQLVFQVEGGKPMDEVNCYRRFKSVLGWAKLPNHFRLYDLRHTHATLLLLAGVHPKIVADRLGHSSVTITLDTYSHVLPGMGREAADHFERMVFAATTDPAKSDTKKLKLVLTEIGEVVA